MFKNISLNLSKMVSCMRFILIFGMVISLSGCIKNTNLVGYTFKNENIEQIKVGKTPEAVVAMILGSPSVTSNYGRKTWYYISSEYETIAFLKPKLKHRRIVAISFNKNDRVADINEYTEKDAKDIAFVKDTTKISGSDISLIGQLLGNVGRFNSEPGRGRPRR